MTMDMTMVLVWYVAGEDRLGAEARRLCDGALERGALYVSAISLFEISQLASRNQPRLTVDAYAWRAPMLSLDIGEAEIADDIAMAALLLADPHRDLADRLIVATALAYDWLLITADEEILRWSGAPQRHDARR